MASRRAVDLALDLMRMPTLAPILSEQPFPSDLLDLIRIAARNADVAAAAAEASSVSERMLRSAAIFYLQEMLFSPGADAYRNLGVDRDASRAQMRLHMRWLLQWLHPDHNPDPAANLLAERVIGAWRQLGAGKGAVSKPIEESSHRPRPSVAKSPLQDCRRDLRVPWIAVPFEQPRTKRKSKHRVIAFGFAVGGAIALMLTSDEALLSWVHLLGVSIRAVSATMQGGAGPRLTHAKTGPTP
jgi:hypothetical protein